MTDPEAVDAHLGAVLDEMIRLIQETKQAVWSAANAEQRKAFDELRSFLVDHVGALSHAEERIGGRSPAIASPSGRQPRNLNAEAHGDPQVMLQLLHADLQAVAADVRRRAGEMDGADEAKLLTTVADGLDARLARLAPASASSG